MNLFSSVPNEGKDFRKEEFQPKLSFGDSVKGFAKSSWQDAITNSSVRAFKKWMYQDDGEEGGRVITKDEANIYFPKAKPWSDEVPLTLARHEHENYIRQEDAKYFSEISLQNGSNILAAVIGSGIGYMTDPAELSMAIGAGAITATGRSLFGVTRNMAPVARTLTRGTVYGAAENVPLEIPYYLVKGYNDEQYGLKDTAMNLAFGGSMGLAMSGLRVKLGDLDMPVELNAKTIQNSYINKLINSDEVSSAKILAEDMNFIRETYKDAIDAIVDDMANKAGIIPTPSQNKILRAKAERLVYQKINNTVTHNSNKLNEELPKETDESITIDTDNNISQVISRQSDADQEIESLGIKIETDDTPEKPEAPKLKKEKKEEPKLDEEQLKYENDIRIDKAFKDTVQEFFPGVKSVNTDLDTKVPKKLTEVFEREGAAYDPTTDTVYYNPKNINEDEVGKTILHEIGIHKGMRGIMDDEDLVNLSKYMVKNHNSEVNSMKKRFGIKDDLEASEEVLAYGYEDGITPPAYAKYLYEKTRQLMGKSTSGSKAVDNVVLQELMYRSLKDASKLRLVNRLGSSAKIDDYTVEEAYFSIKKQEELKRKSDNFKIIQESINKELIKEFESPIEKLQKWMKSAEAEQQRIKLSKSEYSKKIKQRELDAKQEELDYQEYIKELKSIESSKSPLEKLEEWMKSDIAEQRRIDDSKSLYKIKKQKERQDSKEKKTNYKKFLRDLAQREVKPMLAHREIEAKSTAKLQNKEYSRNKDSIVDDQDIDDAYEDLYDMGLSDLRFRRSNLTPEESANTKAFTKSVGPTNMKGKNAKEKNKLHKQSPNDIEDQENFTSEINNTLLTAGIDTDKAGKALKKLNRAENAIALERLANKFDAMPEETKMIAFDNLVERQIPASKHIYKLEAITDLNNKLKQAGGNGFNHKDVWKDTFIASYNRRNKNKGIQLKNPSKHTKLGEDMDVALQSVFKNILGKARDMGLVVGELEEFVSPQSWNLNKMSKIFDIKVERWNPKKFRTELISENLNFIAHKMYKEFDKTVMWHKIIDANGNKLKRGTDESKKYVRDWIQGLYDGKLADYEGLTKVRQSANTAIEPRTFHFYDGATAFDFQQRFGVEDTFSGINNSIDQIATKMAMREAAGPSAETNLLKILDYIGNTATPANKRLQKQVRKSQDTTPISLRLNAGSHRVKDVSSGVKVLQWVKAFTAATKMGNLLFTSASDAAYVNGALKSLDVREGFKEGNLLKILFKQKHLKDKFLLEQNLAMLDAFQGSLVGRFSPEDMDMSTAMSKFNHFMFTVNGMNWHNRTGREMFQIGAVKRMGFASQYSLADLKAKESAKSLVFKLESFGIDDDMWDIMRNAATEVIQKNGKFSHQRGKSNNSVLTWDEIGKLSDQEVKKYLVKKGIKNPTSTRINTERNKLSNKYAAFIKDEMDNGVLTPGIKEQRITTLGLKEGTWGNMAVKLLMQFKSFPIAMYQKVIKPNYAIHGPFKGTVNIAAMAAQAAMISLIADQIKQVIEGKSVKPWNDRRIFKEAVARSGGLSFFADIINRDYSSYGMDGDLKANLGGPTVGLLSDVASVSSQFMKDLSDNDFTKSGTKFVKLADSWTGNIAGWSQLKKALVIHPLLDQLNSDTLKNKQAFLEREFGQDYNWGSPTGDNESMTYEELLFRINKGTE